MPCTASSHSVSQPLGRAAVHRQAVPGDALDDWLRLGETTDNRNFFVTPQWIGPLWRHYGADTEPCIFIYYDDQGPRALFPMCLIRRWKDGLRLRVLGFLTNDESAKPQWLIRGDPAPVLEQWLRDITASRDWDVLHLQDIPAATSGLDRLPALCRAHGLKWRETPSEGARILDVTGSFDEYWQGRSPKLRSFIRNRARLMAKRGLGELRLEVSRPGDAPQPWLDRVLALAEHTWKAAGGTSLADGLRRPLYTDLVRELMPSGQARVIILSVGGVDIAYNVGFVYRDYLYLIKTGFHQDYRELAPGILLLRHLIQYCFQDPDIRIMDTITDREFVRRWMDKVAANRQIWAFNRTGTGRLAGVMARRVRPLGGGLKRLIGGRSPIRHRSPAGA